MEEWIWLKDQSLPTSTYRWISCALWPDRACWQKPSWEPWLLAWRSPSLMLMLSSQIPLPWQGYKARLLWNPKLQLNLLGFLGIWNMPWHLLDQEELLQLVIWCTCCRCPCRSGFWHGQRSLVLLWPWCDLIYDYICQSGDCRSVPYNAIVLAVLYDDTLCSMT